MNNYTIIEMDDGLTVVPMQSGERPEDTAVRHGGVAVTSDIYKSYDEAFDAMNESSYEPWAGSRLSS